MTKSPRTKPSVTVLGVLIGLLLGIPAIGSASASEAATMPFRGSAATRTAPAAAKKAFHKKTAKSAVRRSKVATRKLRASRPAVGSPKVRAMKARSTATRTTTFRSSVTKSAVRAPRRLFASVSVLPTVDWALEEDASFDFDATDGLGFSNWAGEGADASVEMLVSMFGAESVCIDGAAAGCVARRGADELLTNFNEQLTYGRCEGMVAFVGMALESGRDVAELEIAEVEQDIVYWSLSQIAPRVTARMEETRRMQPSMLVAEISDRIRAGRTTTLAMWGEGFAHSVLPVAISQRGTQSEITVWDPNFADKLTTIVVDLVNETWTYADAVDATGARTTLTHSGSGRLGIVENDLRAGLHSARFAD